MTLWFASGNCHKRDELAAIFDAEGARFSLKVPFEEGIAFDPDENGADFAQNALIKGRALWNIVHEPVIADDSGLCVDALDGRPGVFSARYGAQNGKKLDDAARNALLLAEIGAAPRRTARFVCAMALITGEDRFVLAQETLEGEIVRAARGGGGFGYDPLLLVPSLGRTVAELSTAEKNRLSHRAQAARRILAALTQMSAQSGR